MNNDEKRIIIEEIAESLSIPESAYEKAEARYKDLGKWFGREESECRIFDPHIYPQGSFRLGTVVKSDEYDLDFGCRLRQGVTKWSHTQKQLKELVGGEMKEYRKARGIHSPVKEKHRCWRLEYADELSFHMDGVPSIPEEEQRRQLLTEGMIKAGSADALAKTVTNHAGSITDNRLPNYDRIDSEWRVSNSEGYALWFEAQVERGMGTLEKRAFSRSEGGPGGRFTDPQGDHSVTAVRSDSETTPRHNVQGQS